MGRKKLELRKLESLKERSSKFSKRKKGILKKAEEMAVLCDIDIALLLFSPTSKPCLLSRPRSLSNILERFHNVPIRDRLERRAYTVKMLRKMYTKNNEVTSSPERKEMPKENIRTAKLKEDRKLLDKRMLMLRDWDNPYMIDNINRLGIMEHHLVSSLNQIRRIKRGVY